MRPSRWPTDDEDDELQDAYLGIVRADRTWDPDGGAGYGPWLFEAAVLAINAGRQQRRGSGYRATVAAGQFYRAPVTIEAPLFHGPDDRDTTIAETLEAPPLVDLDPDLTSIDTLDSLFEHLNDREWVMVTHTAREAAEVLGIKRTSVLRARVRLYARLRVEYAADAPDSTNGGSSVVGPQRDGAAQTTSEAA